MKKDGYCFLSLLAAVAAQTPAATMDVTPDLAPREIASWFADGDQLEVVRLFDRARQTRRQSCDQERAQERWNEVVEILRACHEDKVFVCGFFEDYINNFGVGGGTGRGNTQHIEAVGPTMAPAAFPGCYAPRGDGSDRQTMAPASCCPSGSDGLSGLDAIKRSPEQALSRLDTEQQRRWHPGTDNTWRIDARHCTSAVPAGANHIEKVVCLVLRQIQAQGFATYAQVRDEFFNASPDIQALLRHNPGATPTQNNCFSRYWTSAVTHEGRSTSSKDRQNLRISCVCPEEVEHASIIGFPKNLMPAFIGLLYGRIPCQYFQARRSKTPNSRAPVDRDASDGSDGPSQYPELDAEEDDADGQMQQRGSNTLDRSNNLLSIVVKGQVRTNIAGTDPDSAAADGGRAALAGAAAAAAVAGNGGRRTFCGTGGSSSRLRLKAAPAAAGGGGDTSRKDANITDADSSSLVVSDAGDGSDGDSRASDAGGSAAGVVVPTAAPALAATGRIEPVPVADMDSAAMRDVCPARTKASMSRKRNNIDVAAEQLANPAMGRGRSTRRRLSAATADIGAESTRPQHQNEFEMTHADLVVGSKVKAEFDDGVWFIGSIVARRIRNGKWTTTAKFVDGDEQVYDDETETNVELKPLRDLDDFETKFWNMVHCFVRTLNFGSKLGVPGVHSPFDKRQTLCAKEHRHLLDEIVQRTHTSRAAMDKVCSMLSAVCDRKKRTACTPSNNSKYKSHDAEWVRVVQPFLSSLEHSVGHKGEAADKLQVTDSDYHKAGSGSDDTKLDLDLRPQLRINTAGTDPDSAAADGGRAALAAAAAAAVAGNGGRRTFCGTGGSSSRLLLKAAPAAAGGGGDTSRKDANIATTDADSSSLVVSDAGDGSDGDSLASNAMDVDSDAVNGLPVATDKRDINADAGGSAAGVSEVDRIDQMEDSMKVSEGAADGADCEVEAAISNAPSPEQERLPPRPVVTMQFNLFSKSLDGKDFQPEQFCNVQELTDVSLNSVLGGVDDLEVRRKICQDMVAELLKAQLPASPHMLCREKLEGLLHGEQMADVYVDLVLFLFANACRLRQYGTTAGFSVDFQLPPENGSQCTDSPIKLGKFRDKVCLHGVYLWEMMSIERKYSQRFKQLFDAKDSRCLGGGTVAVAIKSGDNHFVTCSLSELDTVPHVQMRDPMGWQVKQDDASTMKKVLDGRAKQQRRPSLGRCRIENVPGPIQLLNECSARALNAATGLAVEISHGRYCLPYEADFRDGNARIKADISTTVNAQSDNMRTLVILFFVKVISPLFDLDFHPLLEKVKLNYAGVTVMKEEMHIIDKAPDYGPSTAVDDAAAAAAAVAAAEDNTKLSNPGRSTVDTAADAAAATAAAAEQASAEGSLRMSPREVPRTAAAADAADRQSSKDILSDVQIDAVMEEFNGEFIDCTFSERKDGFFIFIGTFRGVPAEIRIVDHLDASACSNPAFRELQVRRGKRQSHSDIMCRQLLQFNENQDELDVFTLPLREGTAYAIILEVFPGQRPAAGLFDDLAEKCRASPFRPPLAQLTALAHGMLTLLRKFHQGGMALGADPRRVFLLADIKNGHGKTVAAHVLDERENPIALLLGDATHVQQEHFKYNFKYRTEHHRPVQGTLRPHGRVRISQRLVAKQSSTSWSDIREMWRSNGDCLTFLGDSNSQYSNIKEAQAADIGRMSGLIVNILKGSAGNNIDKFWQRQDKSGIPIHLQLLKYCLLDENPGVTKESLETLCGCNADADPPSLQLVYSNLDSQYQDLIQLVAMMSNSDITAEAALNDVLFDSGKFKPPKSEYQLGLDSAPATERGIFLTCEPLMKAIAEKTQHYFAPGGTMQWKGGFKKRISVWLVFTWREKNGREVWDRALFTAEKGTAGDLGAIYQNRIVSLIHRDRISPTHLLTIPGNLNCPFAGLDGMPRSINAEQENIDGWTLGSYINSCRDEKSQNTLGVNCRREWDPEYKTFYADKTVSKPPTSARMALVLLKDMDAYTQLLYSYNWKKEEDRHDRKSEQKTNRSMMEQLAGESGIGSRKTRR